jgi:flagellar operon protein
VVTAMDEMLLRSRMNVPVTTGVAPVAAGTRGNEGTTDGPSFKQVLESLSASQNISFSKHAAGRIAQREIPISVSGLERLSQGMGIAREKGIQDALILMDGSAFIVSAKNNTVITALNPQELKSKAFTNIDGTVIL